MKGRAVSILVLLPLALSAQALRDVAPLKYWPAPLYWQPTQTENRVGAKPELFNAASPQAAAFPDAAPSQQPPNSLVFVAMTPCRLVDTRAGFGFSGAFGPPSLAGSATRSFPLQTSTTCSIPTTAQAYSLNITIVPPGQMFYLTIWPLGSSQPNVSTQNDLLGTVIANAAIVPAGNDAGSGSVNVFVSNNTDLIIDINGYYAPQRGITLGPGTVAFPAVSFVGDAGTGIFSAAPGTVSITSGGASRLTVNSSGDVDIPGSILKNGTLFLHNLGSFNTALGFTALSFLTTGANNTAIGSNALRNTTTGTSNTATGSQALFLNTSGGNNTASGTSALSSNTTGSSNTASGVLALGTNSTGGSNTAVGDHALPANITASGNTAIGSQALFLNTSGGNNTATGQAALYANVAGSNNTADGNAALFQTAGSNNTGIGFAALSFNTSGTNNIGIGYQAGNSVAGGNSNNIHIGSQGVSSDNATIRIGTLGTQTSFLVAGVRGITTVNNDAIPVMVDSNGQLGTVSSSIRFKEDVQDMAGASDGLMRLRPVTYRYKQPYADGSKPVDYGLIAEEVAEIYPDLVVKSAEGQVETVQYQKLTPMLLNEVQKQRQQTEQQNAKMELRIEQQSETIRLLETELAAIKALLSAPAEK